MKYAKSIFVGLLGSLLVPSSFYILLLLGAFYEHKGLINLAQDASDGWRALSFLAWCFVIVPIIIACIGAISLKINSKSGLSKYDPLILPFLSGLISSLLGLILYGTYQNYSVHPSWVFEWQGFLHYTDYIEGWGLIFIVWPFFSFLGAPYFEKIPDFNRVRGLIKKLPKNVTPVIVCLFILAFLIVIYLVFSQGSVYVADAYCDNNTHFNYTIVNTGPSSLNLTYKWHLDDPKAGSPRPIWNNGWTNDYYIGNGTVTVPGKGDQKVVVPLPRDTSYPQMNLIMDIELFDGNRSVYHYREQKDLSGWDYSTLPPMPL